MKKPALGSPSHVGVRRVLPPLLLLLCLGRAPAERARARARAQQPPEPWPEAAQLQVLSAAREEAEGRARLERWCGGALAAQAGRCAALRRLLLQAEQSRSPGRVNELELDAAALADSAERHRIAARVAQSVARQRLMAAKLDAEDAAKDAAALQKVSDQLDKANGYQALLRRLISGAKAEEGGHRDQFALLQRAQEDPGQLEVVHLQEKYRAKRKAILQALQQRFTADRSMEVLTAALEDESVYLADLQTTCEVGKKVYQRLEAGPMTVLNRSLANLARSLQNVGREVLPGARAVDTTASGAGGLHGYAQSSSGREAEDPAPLTLAGALRSLPNSTIAAAQPGSQLPSPPETTSHAQSPGMAWASRVSPNASKASTRHRAAKAAPSSVESSVRKASLEHDALSVKGPTPRVEGLTMQKVDAPQQPKQAAMPARHVSSRVPSQHLRRQAAMEAQHPLGPATLHAASSSPLRLANAIAGPSSMRKAMPEVEAPSGDEPVEVTTEVAKARLQPGSHRAPQAAKKTKDSLFMDGIYSSASGNMPREYSAWTPDGFPPTTEHSAVRAMDASPTKRMLALLGDNDNKPDAPPSPRPAMRGRSAHAHLRSVNLDKPKPSGLHAESAEPAEQDDGHPEAEAPTTVEEDHSNDVARMSLKATRPAQSNADVDTGASAPEATASSAAKLHRNRNGGRAAVNSKAAVPSREDAAADGDSAVPAEGSPATGALAAGAGPLEPQGKAEMPKALFEAEAGGGGAAAATDEGPAAADAARADGASARRSRAAEKPAKKLGLDGDGAIDQAQPKKETSLEQMVADFKNDDESDEEPDAPVAARRGHRREAAAAPRVSAPRVEEANVVYDDDDLPKHHQRPLSVDLEGGWKSFIMKGAAAAKGHKPKLDPDVAIMNNLYSNDGGLPKQYTAWQPSADGPGEGSGHADVEAATKELDSAVAPALTQLSSVTLGPGPVARLVRHAVEAAAGDGENGDAGALPLAFLEESLVASNKSGASVAKAMLEQYSQALHSQTLRTLARAQLAQPKLAELWQRLQKVDPLTHPGAAAEGRQAQAERMCQYFTQNEQSASPLHNAVAEVEKDSNTLADSTSQRAAMSEEADARQQLVRTVEQDVNSLSALLNATRQERFPAISPSTKDMMTLQESDVNSTKELMALQGSADSLLALRGELADLLEATLERRVAVLEAQRAKLAGLNEEARAADRAVEEKQAALKRSTRGVEAAQRRLEGIQASCDATLASLRRRQHAGHMEAHAIEMALKVVGNR